MRTVKFTIHDALPPRLGELVRLPATQELEDWIVLLGQFLEDRPYCWRGTAPSRVVVTPVEVAPLAKQGTAWGWDPGDRGPAHVRRLQRALAAGEWMPPLIVDVDGGLMDGRHRSLALQRLGVKYWPAVSMAQFKRKCS